MTRFSNFTDEELDAMESAFCNEGLGYLEDAIKREQTSLGFSCQNWISEVGLSNAIVAVIPTNKESEE